ncbi:glutaredoxin domain-containing protein [uncultured Ferrimonas sp.]|uniref:glutaredoxin family protein n=1 Tax=uncultured Ferrimonas sp. TaxID=432640 RepID=UPI0026026446|nr:glutaredoxin domain-containing protein [uncultured Ferrimonas sp.]
MGWALAALLMLLLALALRQLSAGDRLGAQLQQQHQAKVLMYGASWCGVCARARRDFAAAGIEYTELDVDSSAENNHQFRQLGGVAVPLFVVNGRVYRGYNRQQLVRALAAN